MLFNVQYRHSNRDENGSCFFDVVDRTIIAYRHHRLGLFLLGHAVYAVGIMRAQDRAEKEDGDFTVLTRICSQLSKDPTCLNPYAAGHYNNESMKKIGEAAGTALGKIRNAEK